jgi:DNA-binding CsgD family transcriptional regulator
MTEQAAKVADDAAADFGAAGEHMRWRSARTGAGRANAWPANAWPTTSISRDDSGRLAWESSMKVARRPSTAHVASHYKLTPSELRVLHALLEMDGGGVRAIAKALGVAQATVKTHLQHIFQKTGTRRQIDLVKLVAGISNPSIE